MSLGRQTRSAVVLAVAALGLGGLAAVSPAAQAVPVPVTDAQFRWGINNETNNRAFAGFNLLSAGELGNPGSADNTLRESTSGATWGNGKPAGWKPTAGNVRIEKVLNGVPTIATWAGTKTNGSGTALGASPGGNTTFSEHQVVIGKGTGTLDAAADDADITWDGDFTVVFYSGRSFFYVSDPHLTVTGGTGSVTATLSGYGADMEDTTTWVPLAATTVTLADLTGVNVTEAGLTTTPEYLGVVAPAGAGADQATTGASWGSFPTSFVNFQKGVGTAEYWYSTGGSVDKSKPTLPLSVVVLPDLVVTAPAGRYGTSAVVGVTVSGQGATPSGNVAVSVAGTVLTKPLVNGKASIALPKTLAARSHVLTVGYSGNAEHAATSTTKTFTVLKANVARPVLKVTKKPTRSAAGRASVTVRSATAGVPVTGKVTVTLVKGGARKVVTVTLKNGTATATLPKLPKGTWRATAVYGGSTLHNKGTSATATIAVK